MKKYLLGIFICLFANADIQKGNSTGTLSSGASHISIGSHPVQKIEIYRGGSLKNVWEAVAGPTITAFSVAPNTIDLDTRSSGTITFTLAVTGTAGVNTNAQIVRLPDGTHIGATFTAGAGLGLSNTLPNILQPTQTTTYRLFAQTTNGTSHKDTTVTVTQNPTISNFRRTGFSQRPDGTRFQFTARITGTPQPTITWRFGNGRSSQRANDSIHCTAVSGQTNTWDCVWGGALGILHPVIADSLVWTATNSSGNVTATISNIST